MVSQFIASEENMKREKSNDEWVQRQHKKFEQWNQNRIARAESRERFNFRVRMIMNGIFILGFVALLFIGIPWVIELYRYDPTLWPTAMAPFKNHAAEFGMFFGFIILLFIILFPLA
jgi:hypothetical protein